MFFQFHLNLFIRCKTKLKVTLFFLRITFLQKGIFFAERIFFLNDFFFFRNDFILYRMNFFSHNDIFWKGIRIFFLQINNFIWKKKKNHTYVRKVGHTSEFLFSIYWWTWKTDFFQNLFEKQLLKWANKKQIILIFTLLHFF